MLERHNEAVWPGQLLVAAIGLAFLALLRRSTARPLLLAAILAAAWAWVGWAFLWKRYASVNWAVTYILPLFFVEAVLFAWFGIVRRRLTFRFRSYVPGLAATALLILGVAVYPLIAALLGRPWQQAEMFGMTPDPTAVTTLGVILLTGGAQRLVLAIAPLLWCILSGATLWALGSPEAWLLLLVVLIFLAALILPRRPATQL
jgi:hypothetical protein